MYFLLEACQHPTILRVLYFMQLFLDIVFVVVPIGLIILLMIDFTKAVISGKEEDQIKSTKLVGKRILYAVIVFAVPWIVNFIMSTLGSLNVDIGGDYNECMNIVKAISEGTDNIEKYDKLLEEEEELQKEKNKANNNSSGIPSTSENATADRMIALAKGELGKTDGTKYGGNPGDPWCAYFVTWVLKNTKMDDGTSIYNYLNKYGVVESIGTASGMWPAFRNSSNPNIKFYKSNAYGGNYTPKKGDIIWFQWPASSPSSYCRKNYQTWDGIRQCSDHVGIVESYDGDVIHTIEGNSSRKVSANTSSNGTKYTINTDIIVAYGSWY